MSLIVRGYNLEKEIRQHNLVNVVRIYREGKAGELTFEEQNLLADLYEGKLKRPKGRPVSDKFMLAEYLYFQYRSLRNYGMTSEEVTKFAADNFEDGKNVWDLLKGCGLSRKDAITRLAEMEIMGEKNVERLVDLGKKIEDYKDELYADIEW